MNKEHYVDLKNSKDRDRFYNKFTEEQKILFDSVKNNIFTFVEANAGCGKAQPLYSKIFTSNGWVQMGDIKLNDEVYGEDGITHKVIGVYPQGKKKIYELTFSDGSKCRCSDEHLWTVSTNNGRIWNTLTLNDIMNDSLYRISYYKKDNKQYKRWKYQIPVTSPIEFTKKNVPVDPWVLGVLLGDGCFTRSAISVSLYEDDIKEKFEKMLSEAEFSLSLVSKNKPTIKDFRITDNIVSTNTHTASRNDGIYNHRMLQYISDLGLCEHKSSDKFIPSLYKFNDIETRVKLLAGLIDTDGYVRNSSIYYSTTSRKLADDVIFLVQSLGGTCSVAEKEAFYSYKGEKRQGNNYFRLYIKLPSNITPFYSVKHKNNYKKGNTNTYRAIRNIEYIGEEECQCIMLDSVTHLYLTDDFIVTHNTSVAMASMVDMLANGDIDKILYIQKPSERSLSEGYLPGDLDEKENILWGAFYDAMLDLGITPDMVSVLISTNQIVLTTDVSLRGVNLSNCGVCIDEGQNLDMHTLKLIFTRCHDNCHVVLLGDKEQKDNHGNNEIFIDYGNYLAESSVGNKCVLTRNFRGKFSQLAENFRRNYIEKK